MLEGGGGNWEGGGLGLRAMTLKLLFRNGIKLIDIILE